MVTFDSPVTVATVVADTDVHESGVQVIPNYGAQLYQVSVGLGLPLAFHVMSCLVLCMTLLVVLVATH